MATSIFRHNFPGTVQLQQASDSAKYIIGLDLHKKTTAMCVIDCLQHEKPLFQRKRLPNAELLSKLQSFPGKKFVVAEAAYGWFTLREALMSIPDVTLCILDARKTSSWIQTSGIKNDAIDAEVLCHVCLHGGIGRLAVHQPSREAKEHFKLVNMRDSLVRHRTSIKNQISAFERDYGANPYTGEIVEPSPNVRFMGGILREELRRLSEQIERLDEQIAVLSKDDAIVSLLRTIPGIGVLTAFALRHKIETIDRFQDPSHLSSYFGFGVRQHQSGENCVKGKITKTGNGLIRKLLIQGAQVVRAKCPENVPLYFPALGLPTLMKDRRHANKVVAALARKNLTFVHQIWQRRTSFDIDAYRERRRQTSLTPVPSMRAAELEITTCL